MAERRMFSKTIIDSDLFLDMPLTTQALYFHLSMRADDDGFINNPKKIQRMLGASDDDLKLLMVKQFIIPFDSGIVVVKHWKVHNRIRCDRYKPSICEEKKLLALDDNLVYQMDTNGIPSSNQTDTNGIPSVNQVVYQMEAQDRLGQESIGKGSIVKDRPGKDRETIDYQRVADMYNDTCVSFPRLTTLSEGRKKAIKARFNGGYGYDDFLRLFQKAEASRFLKGSNDRNWSATFDWLVKDANMAKVLDGNYDERGDYYGQGFGNANQPQGDGSSTLGLPTVGTLI